MVKDEELEVLGCWRFKLILLDEPFAGVDPIAVMRFRKSSKPLKREGLAY